MIYYPCPVANFSASPEKGVTPLTVNFQDNTKGEVTSRYWDFGDGTTSTEQNPSHTYSKTGEFDVYLKVINDVGIDSIVNTNCIAVNVPPPTANFTSDTTVGHVPLVIIFIDQSDGDVTD